MWERGVFLITEMNETGGSGCLGHSNRTICSPLSPFCSGKFQFVSPLYWEAPRRLIVRKGSFPNSRNEWDRGFWVPGAFKLDHLQPFEPFCSCNFPLSSLFFPAYCYYFVEEEPRARIIFRLFAAWSTVWRHSFHSQSHTSSLVSIPWSLMKSQGTKEKSSDEGWFCCHI